MNKLQAFAFTTLATLACSTSFNTIAAPGIGGDATVKGNKAGTVVVSGGKGSVGLGPIKGGSLDLTAGANVNSIVVKGGRIDGSATVVENEVTKVVSTGGQANVNSIVVSK